jgi:16S rRNA C1402 (ribose-2'-O) methylase RsmI
MWPKARRKCAIWRGWPAIVDRGEALVRQIDRAMAEAAPAPGTTDPRRAVAAGGTVPGQARSWPN